MSQLQLHTGEAEPARPTRTERDFILLNVFVLAQQGYIDRAGILAEALYLMDERSVDVLLARAVVQFFKREWQPALGSLEELDRVDPVERFGGYKLTDRQRMRRYLKARCLYEMNQRASAKDAIDSYLRHGVHGREETE